MQRIVDQAQRQVDVLAALVEQRVVGVLKQGLAFNRLQLQGPDTGNVQRLVAYRQVAAKLRAPRRQGQQRLEALVEFRQGIETLQASVRSKQQDPAEVLPGRQVVHHRAGVTCQHKGPRKLHGLVLVSEIQRVHPRSEGRATRAVFDHALFVGRQQVITHVQPGLLLQRTKAGDLGEIAFATLPVHRAGLIKIVQAGVQSELERCQ